MESIGVELLPDDAMELFIHVLWMESCANISAVKEILLQAQDDYMSSVSVLKPLYTICNHYTSLIQPPSKNSLVNNDVESDDSDDENYETNYIHSPIHSKNNMAGKDNGAQDEKSYKIKNDDRASDKAIVAHEKFLTQCKQWAEELDLFFSEEIPEYDVST